MKIDNLNLRKNKITSWYLQEVVDSSCPENGDSDSLKTPVSISGEDTMTESLMDGSTAPAVNYATLLAAGSILPTSSSGKPNTTILLSPPGIPKFLLILCALPSCTCSLISRIVPLSSVTPILTCISSTFFNYSFLTHFLLIVYIVTGREFLIPEAPVSWPCLYQFMTIARGDKLLLLDIHDIWYFSTFLYW